MSGIPAWAVRGARVVCINAHDTHAFGRSELVEGSIYTIGRAWLDKRDGVPVCWVQEVKRIAFGSDWSETYPFRLARFRPLVTTKTEAEDLAHFRKYLYQNAPEAVE